MTGLLQNTTTPRKGLLGLGGIGALGGSTPPAPAGLLGPFYDPAEERRRKIFGAMSQAGIELLRNGRGNFGEVLGQGLAGAVQGANNAGQDYRQNAMGYQQLAQQQEEQRRKEHQRAFVMKHLAAKGPEYAAWAEKFPELAAKEIQSEMFPDLKDQNPMVVGKGSMIYDPRSKTWTSPPAGAGGASQAIDDPLKISKNFETSPGMERVAQIAPTLKSMYRSIGDPSAMADLDFVYGLAKILDPTSVVRESEGRMVIDAQGIAPSMLGQLNKFMSGEQAMSQETRMNLFGVAARRAEELKGQADSERQHFSGVMQENQFNPDTYLQDVPRIPGFGASQNMQQPNRAFPVSPQTGGDAVIDGYSIRRVQ